MIKLRTATWVIIALGLLSGSTLALLSAHWQSGTLVNILFLNAGCGLIAAAFISVVLDVFYSKERARLERDAIEPFLNEFREFTEKLNKLEGRLEAFKKLGLNYCHAARKDALERFLAYARETIGDLPRERGKDPECVSCRGTINIVSSSARGLVGYLDRQPQRIQKEWRDLITAHARNFRILLTHPAYAHLRQPAEERSSGDIELEILKTTIYLHCVAGMKGDELRFYRGSPTAFLIKTGNHILLNPYPYGKMAMDTLCLEFESDSEDSYVSDFAGMHFDHTWAFLQQDSKIVDGKPLVEGIESIDDILKAFSECSFLNQPTTLRLTNAQVKELDTFINRTLKRDFCCSPQISLSFSKYLEENGLHCSDWEPSQAPDS